MTSLDIPLVYACSGCSSAAQMANHFALRLDREGLAEMSCIAGVGGGVPSLLRTVRRPQPILALDGCPLHCVLACLRQAGVEATHSVELSMLGVKKLKRTEFSTLQAEAIWQGTILPAARSLVEHHSHQGAQHCLVPADVGHVRQKGQAGGL